MKENCPNCGAPITGRVCEYCGTRHAKESEHVTVSVDYDTTVIHDWSGEIAYTVKSMPKVTVIGE